MHKLAKSFRCQKHCTAICLPSLDALTMCQSCQTEFFIALPKQWVWHMIRHFDILFCVPSWTPEIAYINKFKTFCATFSPSILRAPPKIISSLLEASNYFRVKIRCSPLPGIMKQHTTMCVMPGSAKIVFHRYEHIFCRFFGCFSRVHCCGSFDSFDWQLNEAPRKIKLSTTHHSSQHGVVVTSQVSSLRQHKGLKSSPELLSHTMRSLNAAWRWKGNLLDLVSKLKLWATIKKSFWKKNSNRTR